MKKNFEPTMDFVTPPLPHLYLRTLALECVLHCVIQLHFVCIHFMCEKVLNNFCLIKFKYKNKNTRIL